MFNYMNNAGKQSKTDQYRSLQILGELEANDSLTQRDLSKRLGIALGLVNSYLKNLVKKGYIKITSLPPRKYIYLLTPSGLSEKTRLTYDLLQGYNKIYHEARGSLKRLFSQIRAEGAESVLFAGSDEVAEIAYLSLQETSLALNGVVDVESVGKSFFGHEIKPVSAASEVSCDLIVVASYWRGKGIYDELISQGVDAAKIRTIFPL